MIGTVELTEGFQEIMRKIFDEFVIEDICPFQCKQPTFDFSLSRRFTGHILLLIRK